MTEFSKAVNSGAFYFLGKKKKKPPMKAVVFII